MSRFARAAGPLLLAGALAACAPQGALLRPVPPGLDDAAAASAGDVLLLIYSAGSRQEYEPDRCDPRGKTTPPIMRALAGDRIAGLRVAVYAACTPHRVGHYDARNRRGTPKVDLRARDLEAIVHRFAQRGVPRAHIVLAGHSAGAWASLRAVRDGHPAVAGVIAFAPAFAGPVRRRSAGWQWLRDRQAAELARAPALHALVFAFDDDAFEPPADLAFLGRIPGVQFVRVPRGDAAAGSCPGTSAHRTVFDRCFARAEGARIRRFLARRVAATRTHAEQSAR